MTGLCGHASIASSEWLLRQPELSGVMLPGCLCTKVVFACGQPAASAWPPIGRRGPTLCL
eukprot:2602575-Karenia_brevis.AAC.1